jgi:hypothetical protein
MAREGNVDCRWAWPARLPAHRAPRHRGYDAAMHQSAHEPGVRTVSGKKRSSWSSRTGLDRDPFAEILLYSARSLATTLLVRVPILTGHLRTRLLVGLERLQQASLAPFTPGSSIFVKAVRRPGSAGADVDRISGGDD